MFPYEVMLKYLLRSYRKDVPGASISYVPVISRSVKFVQKVEQIGAVPESQTSRFGLTIKRS